MSESQDALISHCCALCDLLPVCNEVVARLVVNASSVGKESDALADLGLHNCEFCITILFRAQCPVYACNYQLLIQEQMRTAS